MTSDDIRFCEYEPCKGEFVKTGRSQRYCTREWCMRERKRIQSGAANLRIKMERKTKKTGKRKCIEPGCKHTTHNYFGKCDSCRDRIMTGVDVNFLQIMGA